MSNEYAIIDEQGVVKGTTDKQTAMNELFSGKQVYQITTYQIRIRHELRTNKNE